MAHITEIKIDGLLGRSHPIHLDLRRDVNIFFGDNGGGKTTLLKVLDAAMSRDGTLMETLPVKRAEVHIYSLTDKKVFKHVWERKSRRGSTALTTPDAFWQDEEGELKPFLLSAPTESSWQMTPKKTAGGGSRWSHTFLPTTRLYLHDRTRQSGKTLTEKELDAIFAENVNRSWLRFYSKVMTEVSGIQETGLRNVVNYALAPKLKETIGRMRDPAQAYDRVSNFLKRGVTSQVVLGSKQSFLKRYEAEENLRRIVDSLDTLERQIEEAMIPIDRFEKTIGSLFSQGKKLSTRNNGLELQLSNGASLSMSNLSSGEKHLLKIFLDAMQVGPSTLIIDEPELSMHIDWQRKFVSSIRDLNPNCQLILASHSPEVMADVDDECIFKI